MSKTGENQSYCVPVVMPGIVEEIYISQIKESQYFQRERGSLVELSASIQQNGLLQPILVRPKDNYYEIIAGSRRFLACKGLRWRKIACHVIELDDKKAFEILLIENIQRKALSPIEEAQAFKVYLSDFGWGGLSDLAVNIGKSKSYISKRIKLLNLPSDILHSLATHKIAVSAAEELFRLKDQNKQSVLAKLISERRLSMRMTRELIKEDRDEHDVICESSYRNEYMNHIRLAERSFDKSIAAVRIAMNSLREIINGVEHDWIIHEVLMQHKNMLHAQIDILLKERKKL